MTSLRRRLPSPRLPSAWAVAALAVVLAAGACRDAPTDPLVGLVAQEAYAALALGVSFPDPGAWRASGWLGDEGAEALDAWRASWDLPTADGRALREGAYQTLADGVARSATAQALGVELALLADGIARAEGLVGEGAPPHLSDGVASAARHRASAETALAAGDVEGAAEALLRGGDALREVGPEAVARSLQGEAEAGLGRVSDPHPYSDQEMERLRRLVRGGRQALDEGDWVLAIRRAFYARALLQGNG